MKNEKLKRELDCIELDEAAWERITEQIRKKMAVHRKRRRQLRISVLLLAAFLLLPAVPSIAKAFLAVTERMARMEPEEIDFYETLIQESEGESFHYSREWTEGEKDRWEILKQAYVNGEKYPRKTIRFLETGEKAEPERVCYEAASGTIWLPENEMSDEDMLQILDFFAKSGYSVQIGSAEIKNEPVVSKGEEDIPVQEKEKTDEYLSAFFQEEMESVQLKEEGITAEGNYLYYLERSMDDAEGFPFWQVQADPETGEPLVIEAVDKEGSVEKEAGLKEDVLQEKQREEFASFFRRGRDYLDRIGFENEGTENRCLFYYGGGEHRLTKLVRFYYLGENAAYEMIFTAENGKICLLRKTQDPEGLLKMELARAQSQVKKNDRLQYVCLVVDAEGNVNEEGDS